MPETSVGFTEQRALELIASEKWKREGNLLVSVNSYTPEAIGQYKDALTPESRDAIKLREIADPQNERFKGKKLVLDARSAEAFFAERNLVLSVEAQANSPQR